jgi:hypothetical protein
MTFTERVAVTNIDNNPSMFRASFRDWIISNYRIYADFEKRANHIAQFRQHYSARTIAEVIRHESILKEDDHAFKLNGNVVPDLARLYVLMNPHNSHLFEFRCQNKRAA